MSLPPDHDFYIEALLSAAYMRIDVSSAVMDQIRAGQADTTVASVLSVVQPQSKAVSHQAWWVWAIAIAASVIVLVSVWSVRPAPSLGLKMVGTQEDAQQVLIGGDIQRDYDFSLVYDDHSVLEIAALSVVRIEQAEASKELFIQNGMVAAFIQPQTKEAPFRIRTPYGCIEVIGTRFDVHVGHNSTRVRVDKGQVCCGDIQLSAGEAAIMHAEGECYLGLQSQESFAAAEQHIIYDINFSQDLPHGMSFPRHATLVEDDACGSVCVLSHKFGRGPSIMLNTSEDAFSVSGDIIMHVTFRSDFDILDCGIINTTNSSRVGRIGIRNSYALQPEYKGRWQTLSAPVRDWSVFYYDKDNTAAQAQAEHVANMLAGSGDIFQAQHVRITPAQSAVEQLEIARIWFTKQ